ncbi:MAG: hypothetical protein KF914_17435 [Rhizobiaceae bacterium]|nr:hypothetical protein [Rhizobiaceae bacterium]
MPPDATAQLDNAGDAVPQAAPERLDPVRKRVDDLANAVRSLHRREARGELASLRRMDEAAAIEPAFQTILVRVAPNASLGDRHPYDDARRLALVTKILALGMSIEVLGKGYRNLGEAMAAADVSERRVQGLMTARGPALDDLVLRLSRRLVRAGTLPFLDIGRLLLGSADMVERTRFQIAKGYWGSRRDNDDGDASTDQTSTGGESE